MPGGAGDPDMVPGRGLFAPPERFDQRPFSAAEAARTVTETAVEILRARGEPARYERLLGEILVGLDRAGQLRRLAARRPADADRRRRRRAGRRQPPARPRRRADRAGRAECAGDRRTPPRPARRPATPSAGRDRRRIEPAAAGGAGPPLDAAIREPCADPVERPARAHPRRADAGPTQRRLVEIEPGRWWLGRSRRTARRPPCPSPTASSGPCSACCRPPGRSPEAAFFERIAALFTGHDLPDEALVRACLDSYRSLASTPDRLVTGDDLLRRSQEHTELLAPLADAGHRLGMRVWIGRREQTPANSARRSLGDRLDEREQRAYLGGISRAAEELAEVDCIWYVRGKVAFLFEVEWTAMLGEPLLRRHARIPPDDSLVRFLVIAPGARRARPLQARALAAAARGARRRATGTSSSRTTCGRSSPATRSTSPTSSRTSASTRVVERTRRAAAAVRRLTARGASADGPTGTPTDRGAVPRPAASRRTGAPP